MRLSEPELVPTFDPCTGEPVEAVTRPGDTLGFGLPWITTDDCPDCVALYHRTRGAA